MGGVTSPASSPISSFKKLCVALDTALGAATAAATSASGERYPRVSSVAAYFVHFVHFAEAPAEDLKVRLAALLAYGSATANSQPEAHKATLAGIAAGELGHTSPTDLASTSVLLVVPRSGTISPWSSKATDMAHTCGLSSIHRIERGVALLVSVIGDNALTDVELETIEPLIHDRMTQVVLSGPMLGDLDNLGPNAKGKNLSSKETPRQLKTLPLHEASRSNSTPQELLEDANKACGLALTTDEIDYLVASFMSGSDSEPITSTRSLAATSSGGEIRDEGQSARVRGPGWD
ncbi:hypothetical protein HK405_003883 [Cladochytrium tenue]|nr:hypothetical protein HK405_003883 [Cladochytrium tenue]